MTALFEKPDKPRTEEEAVVERLEDIQEIRKTAVDQEIRNRRTDRLPKFYGSVLTKTLKSKMIECLSESNEDQVSIIEELILTRAAASLSVGVFDDAVGQYEEDKDSPEKRQRAIIAGSLMTESFDKVTRTAKMANDIKQSAKDRFSVFDLQEIIGQIVQIIFASCGSEHQNLAEVMESKIERELSFVQEQTRISPDEIVTQMDLTIPLVLLEEGMEQDDTKTVTEDILI